MLPKRAINAAATASVLTGSCCTEFGARAHPGTGVTLALEHRDKVVLRLARHQDNLA